MKGGAARCCAMLRDVIVKKKCLHIKHMRDVRDVRDMYQ